MRKEGAVGYVQCAGAAETDRMPEQRWGTARGGASLTPGAGTRTIVGGENELVPCGAGKAGHDRAFIRVWMKSHGGDEARYGFT